MVIGKKRILIFTLIVCQLFMISGCSEQRGERPTVSVRPYARTSEDFEEVSQGDIDVSVHVKLNAKSTGTKNYYADHEDMEVSNINYEVGDVVREGDVLVEFKGDEIEKEIRQARSRAEEDQIMYNHVLRLKNIYPSTDYSVDMERLSNDIALNESKISELSAWLEAYTIRSEGDGVVTKVSSIWQSSKVGPKDNLVAVNYQSGIYEGSTIEDHDFKEGEVYNATVGVSVRQVVIDSVTKGDKDENGRIRQDLVVHLVDSIPTDETEIVLDVEKPILKDALFVSKDSVERVEDKYFVYVIDSDNIAHVRRIEGYEGPDNIIIITEGLSKGERVVTGL